MGRKLNAVHDALTTLPAGNYWTTLSQKSSGRFGEKPSQSRPGCALIALRVKRLKNPKEFVKIVLSVWVVCVPRY